MVHLFPSSKGVFSIRPCQLRQTVVQTCGVYSSNLGIVDDGVSKNF